MGPGALAAYKDKLLNTGSSHRYLLHGVFQGDSTGSGYQSPATHQCHISVNRNRQRTEGMVNCTGRIEDDICPIEGGLICTPEGTAYCCVSETGASLSEWKCGHVQGGACQCIP